VTTTLDHASTAIAALRDLWAQPSAGNRSYGCDPYRHIAGTAQDQTIPDGVQNPLWDVVRWMPAAKSWYGTDLVPEGYTIGLGVDSLRRMDDLGVGRNALCTRYAWSIITPGDVEWMTGLLAGRGVVEVGAGSGYWAWQLEQAGVSVAAYDPNPPAEDNNYCKHGTFTTVLPAGAEAAAEHPDRALLMVWPPYGGDHAEEALRAYKGDLLFYAGEGESGCTADDGFYELLAAEWEQVSVSEQHVTWSGIHCELAAYTRKDA
jgi:hypothetical protein